MKTYPKFEEECVLVDSYDSGMVSIIWGKKMSYPFVCLFREEKWIEVFIWWVIYGI